MTQKKHDLMIRLSAAFKIESLTSYNSQLSFDDWQLIDDNEIWIWVNINLLISQYQSSYLSASHIEVDELTKMIRRHERDRIEYIDFEIFSIFRISSHIHIHHTQRSIKSNSNLWRCFWHDSALHAS